MQKVVGSSPIIRSRRPWKRGLFLCADPGRDNPTVLERTQTRTLPVLNRAVEIAPAAQACCGVCRSCMTTNVFTLAAAVVTGASAYLVRRVPRFARR